MSCQNFDKAVHYAKAAFKDALETEELKDETLNLLFHYYQGLKSIRDEYPKHEHKEEAGPIFLSDDITYPTGDISFGGGNLGNLCLGGFSAAKRAFRVRIASRTAVSRSHAPHMVGG